MESLKSIKINNYNDLETLHHHENVYLHTHSQTNPLPLFPHSLTPSLLPPFLPLLFLPNSLPPSLPPSLPSFLLSSSLLFTSLFFHLPLFLSHKQTAIIQEGPQQCDSPTSDSSESDDTIAAVYTLGVLVGILLLLLITVSVVVIVLIMYHRKKGQYSTI